MILRTSPTAVCCCRDSLRSLVRCLNFVEQPHILDGDHGLVGEGLQQLNVMVGERARLARVTLMMPIGTSVAHQRHEQHAAEAARSRDVPDSPARRLFGVGDLRSLAVLAPAGMAGKSATRLRERRAFSASSAAGLVGVNAAR